MEISQGQSKETTRGLFSLKSEGTSKHVIAPMSLVQFIFCHDTSYPIMCKTYHCKTYQSTGALQSIPPQEAWLDCAYFGCVFSQDYTMKIARWRKAILHLVIMLYQHKSNFQPIPSLWKVYDIKGGWVALILHSIPPCARSNSPSCSAGAFITDILGYSSLIGFP